MGLVVFYEINILSLTTILYTNLDFACATVDKPFIDINNFEQNKLELERKKTRMYF